MRHVKVVFCGEQRVGKTTLLNAISNKPFSPRYIATPAVDFIRIIQPDTSITCIDIAGDLRYETIVNSFYGGAHNLFYCIDATKLQEKSFDHDQALVVLENIKKKAPTAKITIILTKTDTVPTELDTCSQKVKNFILSRFSSDQIDQEPIMTSAKNMSEHNDECTHTTATIVDLIFKQQFEKLSKISFACQNYLNYLKQRIIEHNPNLNVTNQKIAVKERGNTPQALAIKKYNAVLDLVTLLDSSESCSEKITQFRLKYGGHQATLEQRRDSGFITFLKCIASIIPGLYHRLWRVEGREFTKNIDTSLGASSSKRPR